MHSIPQPNHPDGDIGPSQSAGFEPLDIAALRRYLSTDPDVVRPYPVTDPLGDDDLDAAVARFDAIDVETHDPDDDKLFPQLGGDGRIYYLTGHQIRTAKGPELQALMDPARRPHIDARPIVAAGGHAGERFSARAARLVIVLPAVLALLGAFFIGYGPDAHAATGAVKGPGLDLRAGAHHPISRTVHAGDWVIDGRPVTCVTYGLATGTGPLTVGAPIGMPDAKSQVAASYIENVTPATLGVVTGSSLARNADHVAAWRWFALATLIVAKPGAQPTAQGRAAAANLRADLPGYVNQISVADRAAIAALLAEAGKHTGAYRVTATAPKAAPGATVESTVTVTSAGRPMAGIPVTVKALGATVAPAAVVTDRSGRAVVRVTPSSLTYTLQPVATVPLTTVRRTPVITGRQTMIGAAGQGTVTGTACVTICPVKARITIDAPCDSKGRHDVTVTYTVEDIPGAYRGVIVIGGVENVIGLAPGETREVSTLITDGQSLTVGYRILDPDTGRVLVNAVLYRSAA